MKISNKTEEMSDLEKLYSLFKKMYQRDEKTEFGDKHLTREEFIRLTEEKIGGSYTLVTDDGVINGMVQGGTIAVDDQFSDLFRIYLDLKITESHKIKLSKRNSKIRAVGFRGSHIATDIHKYKKREPGRDQKGEIEKMVRERVKKNLNKYKLVYYQDGLCWTVMANNAGFKDMDNPEVFSSIECHDSGAYLFEDNKLSTFIPVKYVPANEGGDTPSRYRALSSFRMEGSKYYWLEEYGQTCCTGGPFSTFHVFKNDTQNHLAELVGLGGGYPLCMALFL
jgi:hypothetical protein